MLQMIPNVQKVVTDDPKCGKIVTREKDTKKIKEFTQKKLGISAKHIFYFRYTAWNTKRLPIRL